MRTRAHGRIHRVCEEHTDLVSVLVTVVLPLLDAVLVTVVVTELLRVVVCVEVIVLESVVVGVDVTDVVADDVCVDERVLHPKTHRAKGGIRT